MGKYSKKDSKPKSELFWEKLERKQEKKIRDMSIKNDRQNKTKRSTDE